MKKGMMSQRLRHYDQIESDCILMLDDDVSLQPESVAKMLAALEENEVDCVGADTFRTHEMPLSMKIYAALTNLVFPHRDDGWAFKIKTNGSFSYNRKPTSASRRAAPEMPCCGAKIPTTSCISMMNCGSTNSLLLTETTCWSPTRSIRMDTDWGALRFGHRTPRCQVGKPRFPKESGVDLYTCQSRFSGLVGELLQNGGRLKKSTILCRTFILLQIRLAAAGNHGVCDIKVLIRHGRILS